MNGLPGEGQFQPGSPGASVVPPEHKQTREGGRFCLETVCNGQPVVPGLFRVIRKRSSPLWNYFESTSSGPVPPSDSSKQMKRAQRVDPGTLCRIEISNAWLLLALGPETSHLFWRLRLALPSLHCRGFGLLAGAPSQVRRDSLIMSHADPQPNLVVVCPLWLPSPRL